MADSGEGEHEGDDVARLYQQHDGGEGEQDVTVEGAFALFAIDIGAAVAHHHPAHETHQQQHGGAEDVLLESERTERDHRIRGSGRNGLPETEAGQ